MYVSSGYGIGERVMECKKYTESFCRMRKDNSLGRNRNSIF